MQCSFNYFLKLFLFYYLFNMLIKDYTSESWTLLIFGSPFPGVDGRFMKRVLETGSVSALWTMELEGSESRPSLKMSGQKFFDFTDLTNWFLLHGMFLHFDDCLNYGSVVSPQLQRTGILVICYVKFLPTGSK